MNTRLLHMLRTMAIRQKIMLIVVVTAATALLLAGLAVMITDSVLYKQLLYRDLTTFAQVIADNSTGVLAFDDDKSASQTLAALRAKVHVVSACLYRDDGTTLAGYWRETGARQCPERRSTDGIRKFGDHLSITKDVELNGRHIGTLAMLYDLNEIGERMRLYGAAVVIVILLASMVALMLSSRLSAIIATPVLDLAGAATSVSRTRDYGIRAEKLSDDEIGLLADSFNEMLTRIQTRDRELTEALSAEREALRRLAQLNSDLRRSNEDLERFAFVASHDLQEPLRNIAISSQLLVRLYPGEFLAESRELVDRIFEGAKRMSDLLTDLRSYMEVSTSRRAETETVDLNLAFDCALVNLKATIDETNATVTSDRLPSVAAGYPADFIVLFQNLVGNAIKYRSPATPEIHVSAQPDSDGAFRIAVRDNGIGISPAYHARIFKPFIRLHGQEIPGTGIGLAICQRVVERYKGRIWVESDVGKGATFLFTIHATAHSSASS